MADAEDCEARDTEAADSEILRRHVAGLMEHWDAVQIFATRSDRMHTVSCNNGSGNLYARHGMAREWIIQQDAMADQNARDRDDDDDGE